MNKTYFQYQGTIRSQSLVEAISFPIGIGPFMGFAKLDMNNMSMIADPDNQSSDSLQGKYYDNLIRSNNYSHSVGFNPTDVNRYKFGLITKSGHIFVSDAQSLPITVLNGSSGRSELIVLAIYKNIEEPIINEPTLVGYWNTSDKSFYEEFFLNTVEQSTYNLGDTINDVRVTKTFKDLYDTVNSVINNVKYESNMVLVGIYGEGINPVTQATEPFSIVPYHSKYPNSQPFTPAIFYTLKGAIDGISNFLGEEAGKYTDLKSYITSLITPQDETKEDDTLKGVPIGTIVMWNGSTIPTGWAICDGSQGTPDLTGKFIRAASGGKVGEEGGKDSITLDNSNIPLHDHEFKDYYHSEKPGVLKSGTNYDSITTNNKVGADGTDHDNTCLIYYKHKTDPVGSANPTPISILPRYYSLLYIMRIA